MCAPVICLCMCVCMRVSAYVLSRKRDIISCHQGQRLLSNFTSADCRKRCFSSAGLTALSLVLSPVINITSKGKMLLMCAWSPVHLCGRVCIYAYQQSAGKRARETERGREREGGGMYFLIDMFPWTNKKEESVMFPPDGINPAVTQQNIGAQVVIMETQTTKTLMCDSK